MSRYQEDPAPPETPGERAEAKAAAAATRRRWLTLAETVAIIGVTIAALTLWNNWQGRRDENAARAEARREAAAADQQAATASSRFDLEGVVADNGRAITLQRDERHALGNVIVRFPKGLGVAPQTAYGQKIEAAWFDDALLKATDGGPDERTGALPVLVSYDYWVGDQKHSKTALYDVAWKTEGQMLRGRRLSLIGFRLHALGGDQARLDAIWTREKPQ